MAESEKERLFIGVPVPEATQREIASQLPSPIPGRPVDSGKWHFTLRFLGGMEAEARILLSKELRAAPLGNPFGIGFSGLGAFPSPGRARVLWVGVKSGKEELESLARRVEEALKVAGIAPDPRPFKAHLTLSRIHPPSSVRMTVARGRDVHASMRVDRVILFRSHLRRGGSRHEIIERFPLR